MRIVGEFVIVNGKTIYLYNMKKLFENTGDNKFKLADNNDDSSGEVVSFEKTSHGGLSITSEDAEWDIHNQVILGKEDIKKLLEFIKTNGF